MTSGKCPSALVQSEGTHMLSLTLMRWGTLARPLLHPQTHVSVPTTLLGHHLTHIVDSSVLWPFQIFLLSSTCMLLLQILADSLPVHGHLTWLSKCRGGSNSNAQAGLPPCPQCKLALPTEVPQASGDLELNFISARE